MKLQYKERIHKLSAEVKTLEDVLKQIHLLYKEKIPSYFSIRYRDGEKETVQIINESDLQQAQREFSGRTLKLEIFEESNDIQNKMLTSRIRLEAEHEELQVNQQDSQLDLQLQTSEVETQKRKQSSQFSKDTAQAKVEESKEVTEGTVSKRNSRKNSTWSELEDISLGEDVIQDSRVQKSEKRYQNSQPEASPFTCFKCLDSVQKNGSCEFCAGTGKIPQNHWIIRLINQVISVNFNGIDQQKQSGFGSRQSWTEVKVVHPNTQCQSCFMSPITGTRYKCRVCSDFSFCPQCKVRIPQHRHDFTVIEQPEQVITNKDNSNDSGNKGQDNIVVSFIKNIVGIQSKPVSVQEQPSKPNSNYQKTNKQEFRAQFDSDPQKVINSIQGKQFQWSVTFKNSGKVVWPESTQLHCVNGPFKGFNEPVRSLKPGESHKFDLVLQTPEPGRHNVAWRLSYHIGNDLILFGPRAQFELIVQSQQLPPIRSSSIQQDSGIICKEANSQNLKTTQTIIEKAKKLSENFGGDFQEFVKFIQLTGLQNESIETLCELYLAQQQQEQKKV